MVSQVILAVVLCVGLTSLGFLTYYWGTYIAGDNLFREFIVVYRQVETTETVEVDGRPIERRSYVTEAMPDTTRWALILPPLLVNNLIIAVVLSVLGIRHASRIAGPIYRMSTDIRRALAGETGVRIHLRRRDEMRDLAQRVNGLLEALEVAETRGREE
jgi:methyl-accepting chemotaxis protein